MGKRLLPTSLGYLEQVARAGSIQKAARELNIAPSAIDRQIMLLEGELGVPLFERLHRGMRPTAAGETIVALARRWRGDVQRVAAEIKQIQGFNQGHVRLLAMDSHVNGLLPAIVSRLAAEHPKITLEIEIGSTDMAAAALANSEADAGLVFNLAPSRAISIVAKEDLPFGCVVAPTNPLAQQTSTTLQKVAAHPIALQSRSLMIRRYLEAKHAWIFERHPPPVVTNSLQLIKMLARTGKFVAFTSELDAATEILEGTLVFVPVRDRAAEPQSVSVAVSNRLQPRIVQLVADICADEIVTAIKRVRAKRQRSPNGRL